MTTRNANVVKSRAAGLAVVTGKSQWILWFSCMTSLAVLLVACHNLLKWDGGITLVIFLLFAATTMKSFKDITFLDRETTMASQQVKLLREVNDIARFLKEAPSSIFRSHIASLHTIFLSNAHINQDNLIEVTHARLIARNKVVELFASILITLGLIGTIVGLIAASAGLKNMLGDEPAAAGVAVAAEAEAGVPTASPGQEKGLMQHMKDTVAGLSTAFFTTLFGAIFGGVILRILTSVVDANILNYMAHLSELTEVHVLPAMRRTAARLEAGGYYQNLDRAR